jgi:hypothetical protein
VQRGLHCILQEEVRLFSLVEVIGLLLLGHDVSLTLMSCLASWMKQFVTNHYRAK